MSRCDRKQGLDRPCGIFEAPQLKLDPRQSQAQLWTGWATLDCRGRNGLGLRVSSAREQEVSKRMTGRGEMRFCHDRLSQQILRLHLMYRCVGPF